jgi:hypothetical protein
VDGWSLTDLARKRLLALKVTPGEALVPETSALPNAVPDPSASLPPNTVPERSAPPLILRKREEDISEKSEGDVSGTTGGGDRSGTLPSEGRYWPPFDDDDDAEPAVLVGKPN